MNFVVMGSYFAVCSSGSSNIKCMVTLMGDVICEAVSRPPTFNPSNALGFFRPKHKNAKIFENHSNPVMLVFIGKLSLSALI